MAKFDKIKFGIIMLNKIIDISKEAGEIIKNGFGKNIKIDFKSGENNLVTEIDKKAEKCIIDFIKKEFPSHSILAEESGQSDGNSDYLWVIDPLDGTTNFAHGLPIFSVSIGLRKNRETICGVIYDIMRNQVYAAELNSGAYCNSDKIMVNENSIIEKSLLVTGFPYEIGEKLDRSLDVFKEFVKTSRGVRRLGSAAIDLCYVANGTFDAFWEEKLNPWDVCAGMLIVEEAGGKLCDFNGNPIDIYSKEILASNGKIEENMLKIINF